ncbi:MAG: tRNA 2-thiouridine(34) synthase MnmA [Clostridia bacterium]|nr:tRNA 2-thiouridine(34) synthase MnmA [Clostridia bacterium]
MELNKKRVVLGMSGGVDSSATAKLLVEAGYEVIGVSLRLHQDVDDVADFKESMDYTGFEDAKNVCDQLGIPFKVFHLRDAFKKHVRDYLVNTYLHGETPNPCIECNKHIKFGAFMEIADGLGAYYLATGHYCYIEQDERDGYYKIKKANSSSKDQTYMMFYLGQEQLKRILMPLGAFDSKDDIRAIVAEMDLNLSKKKDSQEICFIPGDDYIAYLKDNYGVEGVPGHFVDEEGHDLGQHKGMIHYTIGQRKGLGVSFGKPMYVVALDTDNNQVVLGDNEDLFESDLTIYKTHFAYSDAPEEAENLTCKIRYSSKEIGCHLEKLDDETYKVHFEAPQRAITPGQACVIYQGDYLFGGGIIKNSKTKRKNMV